MSQKVKMYTISTCIHCKKAKKLMDDCHVKYEFTDVDLLSGREKETIMDEVKKLNSQCTFPTIVIGGNVIVGYKEDEIKDALGIR